MTEPIRVKDLVAMLERVDPNAVLIIPFSSTHTPGGIVATKLEVTEDYPLRDACEGDGEVYNKFYRNKVVDKTRPIRVRIGFGTSLNGILNGN